MRFLLVFAFSTALRRGSFRRTLRPGMSLEDVERGKNKYSFYRTEFKAMEV
jgi:hypothetical protein